MVRTAKILAGAAVFLAGAVPAQASPLLFQLSGSKNATFQIDSNRTPDTSSSSAFGSQIQYQNVAGTFSGLAGVASSIGFGTGPIFAQLNINGTSLGFAQFGGPDLFTGTATSPMFVLGTFALTSIVSGSSSLTISAVPNTVPEPSALSLLLGGIAALGMVGFAARRDSSEA